VLAGPVAATCDDLCGRCWRLTAHATFHDVRSVTATRLLRAGGWPPTPSLSLRAHASHALAATSSFFIPFPGAPRDPDRARSAACNHRRVWMTERVGGPKIRRLLEIHLVLHLSNFAKFRKKLVKIEKKLIKTQLVCEKETEKL
jgi:hypothetical protein